VLGLLHRAKIKSSEGSEVLTGKSILKNFISDYQRGAAHAEAELLLGILQRNSLLMNQKLDAEFTQAFRLKYP